MKPTPQAETPSLFEASVPRCEGFAVRVSLREATEWNGAPHVDLRVWSAWKPGAKWSDGAGGMATRKGFTLPVEQLPALITACEQALAAAKEHGLVSVELEVAA